MWKFYFFVVIYLLAVYPNDTECFFPGFPFPEHINFPAGMWDLHRLMRPPNRRPRPRPTPDDTETCPDEGIKLISHPKNCEKYILCVDGAKITELTCPNGLHFSRITRSCVDPRAAGCEDFEWECPEVDTPGTIVFLPNKNDCNGYFLCWSGNQIPMTCAPGLHWSIFENTCMDPIEANCQFSLMSFPTKQTQGQKTENEAQTTNLIDQKPKAFGSCPTTGIESIPNPSSCEEFVLCINGARFERQCPQGLHFSPTLRNCVSPDQAGCTLSDCPSTGLAFLPHEDDCNLYYICFMGMRNLMRCPNELHWSTDENRCMNPDEAGCDEGLLQCPPTGIEQIPDPEDCERFILCLNGLEIPLPCGPGLHFSPTLRTCMPAEDAGCEEQNAWSCPEIDTPGVIVFIPNPEDCNAYFLCWQGNEIPLRCPSNLHWSKTENRCLPPDQANCPWDDKDDIETCPPEGVISISHPQSCEHFFLCVNGVPLERECPPGTHFSREIRSCVHPLVANCRLPRAFDMPADGGSCPNIKSLTDAIFMPNKDDCTSYYLCLKDESKLFSCAKGLHFDVKKKQCRKQEKAECVVSQ